MHLVENVIVYSKCALIVYDGQVNNVISMFHVMSIVNILKFHLQ